jgi:G:T-mismatch repair DNA endonuclease (very short patch repair protein)
MHTINGLHQARVRSPIGAARQWPSFVFELGSLTKPRPDIVFTRPEVAVFADGHFWHGWPAFKNHKNI